jgi:hypothetical protein
MSRTSHPPLLDYSDYTCQIVQIMKLFIMQFSPLSCHVIPLQFKGNATLGVHSQNPHSLLCAWLSYLNVSFITAFKYDSLLMMVYVTGSSLSKYLRTS